MKHTLHTLKTFFHTYKGWLLVVCILIVQAILRFYQLDTMTPFGWDQVDNAWASVNIMIHHHYPLLGMVAKGNSGIYIGPLYYYLIAPVYFFTNFDPIAAGIFAGIASIISAIILFYVTKKLFSFNVAVFALFINAVALQSILFDRVQWPVAFIPCISLFIFYALYNVLLGKSKFIILLAILLGISLHIHFTSIFYFIITICALPFFPRTKETFLYILYATPLFVIFLIPNIIAEIGSKNANTGNFLKYSNTYYHGFHLRRVMQLAGDAFIQFENYIPSSVKFIKFIAVPFFSIYYFLQKKSRERVLFIYLLCLWFIIPWIVFSTYKGEISDYYFAINRYFVIILLAYFINEIFRMKFIIIKALVVLGCCIYMVININQFLGSYQHGIKYYKERVNMLVQTGQIIQFQEGAPESYIYYIDSLHNKK